MSATETHAFAFAERLQQLPPYLFLEIDAAKRRAREEGRDIIDLGIGDPDLPTPEPIVAAMKEALDDPANHHYALDAGLPDLREAIAARFERRFHVSLDPETEIYPVIGSKEGLAHFPLGVIDPRDKVLLPDPCYPAYRPSVIFAGGKIVTVPLREAHGFLPDLKKIADLKDLKAVYVNYPANPTAAVASREFYEGLVALARDKGIILVSDMAYSEIYYDGERPLSLLEVPGAKEVAIEFHSFSKTYNMTGWRIGWACGCSSLIAALAKVKSNFDSGIFQAVQAAAIRALETPEEELDDMRFLYQERRDCLVNGLRAVGWKLPAPRATFYVWGRVPKGFASGREAAGAFLERAGIVATPGEGFGSCGEGYIRMALTVPKERIQEAVTRLGGIL